MAKMLQRTRAAKQWPGGVGRNTAAEAHKLGILLTPALETLPRCRPTVSDPVPDALPLSDFLALCSVWIPCIMCRVVYGRRNIKKCITS